MFCTKPYGTVRVHVHTCTCTCTCACTVPRYTLKCPMVCPPYLSIIFRHSEPRALSATWSVFFVDRAIVVVDANTFPQSTETRAETRGTVYVTNSDRAIVIDCDSIGRRNSESKLAELLRFLCFIGPWRALVRQWKSSAMASRTLSTTPAASH